MAAIRGQGDDKTSAPKGTGFIEIFGLGDYLLGE